MGVFVKLLFCFLFVALYNVDLIDAKNTTVLCYMWTWALHRPNQGKFTVKDVDTKHCTHVVYAHMIVDEDTSEISMEPSLDFEGGGEGLDELNDLQVLKYYNRDIKVLASVGGYKEGSAKFSEIARTSSKRALFINSLIKFIRDWKLDGIDISWEYPGRNGGSKDDKENFVGLLKITVAMEPLIERTPPSFLMLDNEDIGPQNEIKAALEPEGWLLTVFVLAHRSIIDEGYDVKSISQIADYINLYATNYNGPWDRKTGINAPLNSTDGNDVMSMVDYVLKEGATPSKILLGLPTYGRTYVVQDNIQNGHYLGLFSDKTFPSQWSDEHGVIAYYELCLNNKTIDGWTEVFDEDSFTPVAYYDNKFISFDNEKSLIEKAKLVISRKLGGIMLWSLDMDDFRGLCNNKRYPLLSAVTEFLINKEIVNSNEEISDQSEPNTAVNTYKVLNVNILTILITIIYFCISL